MYLSNAEKEALQLTGYGDVPPWAVEQGLEQALGKGTYIPGEESLRIRLADALDLEERLAAQQAEVAQEEEPSQEAEEATTEDQEAAEEPPADEYHSPLEIVTEGAEESELEVASEEEAAPAAEAQRIKDCDFSSFTKTQLETFAADMFGVDLDRRESRDRMIARVQELVDEASEKAV
jgi:hypothetical protein